MNLLLCSCSFLLYAQDVTKKSMHYEVQASYNQTYFVSDYNSKGGFGVALTHVFDLKKNVQFTFGYAYNLTNASIDTIGLDINLNLYNAKLRYQFIALPFTLRFSVGSRIRVLLEPGFSFEYELISSLKGTEEGFVYLGSNIYQYVNRPYKSREHLDNIDLCPTFALGIQFPINKHQLILKTEAKFGINYFDRYDYLQTENRYWRIVTAFQF